VSSSALLIKALLPKATDKAEPAQESQEPEVSPMRAHALAMGLIAILAGYLVVLPWLGYIVSVGLLACVVAWFAGGRERNTLIGFAVLTGPVLWFFFDYALKIHMPAGFWPALFSG
jgi:cell division protein FtsW (lipid II flippase)